MIINNLTILLVFTTFLE